MSKLTVRLSTPAQVAAAVSTILGFHPAESLVILSCGGGPTARIDIPRTGEQLQDAGDVLAPTYRRHPGTELVLVAYTSDPEIADDALKIIGAALADSNRVVSLIHVNDAQQWHEIRHGVRGSITQADHDHMAAPAAYTGQAAPAASRAVLAATVEHDPAHAFSATLVEAATRVEPSWVSDQISLATHGQALDDLAAATIVAALAGEEARNAVLELIDRNNAHYVLPVLTELTRRAPHGHRDHVATLTALIAWITGNGALAWSALDQVEAPTELSQLTGQLLQAAVNPNAWDEFKAQHAG